MTRVPKSVRARIMRAAWRKADKFGYADFNNQRRRRFMDSLWSTYKKVLAKYGASRVFIKDSIMKGYRTKSFKFLTKLNEHDVVDRYAKALIARGADVYKSKSGSYRCHLGRNLTADLYVKRDIAPDTTPKVVEVESPLSWERGLIQAIKYAAIMAIEGKCVRGRLVLMCSEKDMDKNEAALIKRCCEHANVDLVFG